MIGIVLVSHGLLAEGLKDSIALIMGIPERFDTVSLAAGEDLHTCKKEIIQKIIKLNDGDGVLVFADLFGASPYNATQYARMVLHEEHIQVRLLSGMNLPMVLETLVMRNVNTLQDVARIAFDAGRGGILEAVDITLEEHDTEGDYE